MLSTGKYANVDFDMSRRAEQQVRGRLNAVVRNVDSSAADMVVGSGRHSSSAVSIQRVKSDDEAKLLDKGAGLSPRRRSRSHSRIPRHQHFVGVEDLPPFDMELRPAFNEPTSAASAEPNRVNSVGQKLGCSSSTLSLPAALAADSTDDDDDNVSSVTSYSQTDAARSRLPKLCPADYRLYSLPATDNGDRALTEERAPCGNDSGGKGPGTARRTMSCAPRFLSLSPSTSRRSVPLSSLPRSIHVASAADPKNPDLVGSLRARLTSDAVSHQTPVGGNLLSRFVHKIVAYVDHWVTGLCTWMLPGVPASRVQRSHRLQRSGSPAPRRVGRAWWRRLLHSLRSQESSAQRRQLTHLSRRSPSPAASTAAIPTPRAVTRKSSTTQTKLHNSNNSRSSTSSTSTSSSSGVNRTTSNSSVLSNNNCKWTSLPAEAEHLLIPRDIATQLGDMSGWPASPYRTRQTRLVLANLPVDNLFVLEWLVTRHLINSGNAHQWSMLLSVKPSILHAFVDEAEFLFHDVFC